MKPPGRWLLARGCSALAPAQRLIVALPPLAYLLLARAQVVGRGCERHGTPYLHEHDGPDLAFDSTLAVEREGFVEQVSLREHHTGALEAVPLARDGVDDVDLDRRVVAQVLDRARRADVGKDEPIGVPEGCGALGREVGRTVGADGRGVAEALLFHHAPHLLVERPHTRPSLVRYGCRSPGTPVLARPPARLPAPARHSRPICRISAG